MVNGYRIIDLHCHIYPEKVAAKAVAGTDAFYNETSKHTGTLDDLLSHTGGVDRFVVHSVATTTTQVEKINTFIAEMQAKHGELYGFGTLHPGSDDIKGDVNRLISLGLHGVKMHPDIQGFKLDDYRFLKIFELCERHNLPVLLHTGDLRYDYSNPNRLIPISETYTDLKLIGAHLGGYTMWEKASYELAGAKNLYFDSSSSLPYLEKETARDIIRRLGASRVLFGTDYPMHDPAEEIGRMMSLGLTKDELTAIFYENASALLGI